MHPFIYVFMFIFYVFISLFYFSLLIISLPRYAYAFSYADDILTVHSNEDYHTLRPLRPKGWENQNVYFAKDPKGWNWPMGQSLTKGDTMVVFFCGTMFPGGWEADFKTSFVAKSETEKRGLPGRVHDGGCFVFIRLFIYLFVNLFNYSCIYLFIYLFIYSFVYFIDLVVFVQRRFNQRLSHPSFWVHMPPSRIIHALHVKFHKLLSLPPVPSPKAFSTSPNSFSRSSTDRSIFTVFKA